MAEKQGCGWELSSPKMKAYHDDRWCKPVHEDHELFAMLVLEGAQAGLSWATIIEKEARYREVFDGFDPASVACYSEEKIAALLQDPGIIRLFKDTRMLPKVSAYCFCICFLCILSVREQG